MTDLEAMNLPAASIVHQPDMTREQVIACCEANAMGMGEYSNLGDLLTHCAALLRRNSPTVEEIARAVRSSIGDAWVGEHQAEVAAQAIASLYERAGE